MIPLTKPLRRWTSDVNRSELAFLVTITAGHLVIHWYTNLLSLSLPFIKEDLMLTNIQVGSIVTVQMGVNGFFYIVSGFLADSFSRRGAIIVASAVLSYGIAFFIIGLSPSYTWTLVGAGMVGLGTALWHPAAMRALSLQFSSRRGVALSIHGVGASMGDAIGPVVVGAIILTFSWKIVLELHLIPAIIVAVILWRGLPLMKKIDDGKTTLKSYTSGIWEMFQDSQVLTIMLSNTLIKMGQLSILAFFPIYIKESLGYSAFALGIYLSLLYLMGIVSQPVMGILSDQIGRKSILVPSYAMMGILYAGIVIAPTGALLGIIVGMLGMFFYPILNMTQTAIMDVAPKQVQASTMGVMGLLSQPVILGSPILAGYLVTNSGIESAFWYAAITALAASVVLLPIRFRKTI